MRIFICRQKYYRKIFCVKEKYQSKSSLQSGTIDLNINLFHFMLCHFKILSSFIFLFQANERLCIAYVQYLDTEFSQGLLDFLDSVNYSSNQMRTFGDKSKFFGPKSFRNV